MLRLSASVCIDAPASKVWDVLSDLESIHLWAPPIRRSHCIGSQTRGRGAVRVCELQGNVSVRETIVSWTEGESFAYLGEGAPPMKRALNLWKVEARGLQSLVTSVAEVELKGGMFGRLLEPALAPLARRMGASSLASFKYLVETGRPYLGKLGPEGLHEISATRSARL
jgi:carbon monoxide dehydrogenase subunit G